MNKRNLFLVMVLFSANINADLLVETPSWGQENFSICGGNKKCEDNVGGLALWGIGLYALYGLGCLWEELRNRKEKKQWEKQKRKY